jgi:hypothetical protein
VIVAALIVALALALVGALALWLALRRARAQAAAADELVFDAQRRLREVVEKETAAHTEEIRRLLARERADSISLLQEEERRLADAHTASLAEREHGIRDALATELAAVERRVDERLRAFTDDVDRVQQHLETQTARLEQKLRQAVADVEARIDAEAAELGSTAAEQRAAVLRLREQLEQAASAAVAEALDALESETIDRRRAIEEISERLRAREKAIADGIDSAESDARARLDVAFVEFERRQGERVERAVARELERHVQAATLTFEERMRELREEAANRLARELERAIDLLGREELARRLDLGAPTRSGGR